MTDSSETRPLPFRIVKWYGFIFSGMYVLWGGVSILLKILDRDTSTLAQPIIVLLLGLAMLAVCYAFRDAKTPGWYGLLTINGLIILNALIGFRDPLNLVYLVVSAAAIGLMLTSPVRQIFFVSGRS